MHGLLGHRFADLVVCCLAATLDPQPHRRPRKISNRSPGQARCTGKIQRAFCRSKHPLQDTPFEPVSAVKQHLLQTFRKDANTVGPRPLVLHALSMWRRLCHERST